jgi:protocatechuate 3,4-dioxygenase beta subunit
MAGRRRLGVLGLLAALAVMAGTVAVISSGGRRAAARRSTGIARRPLGPEERRPRVGFATAPRPAEAAAPAAGEDPRDVPHPASLTVVAVREEDGAAVADAEVFVRDAMLEWSGRTDAAGRMEFPAVEAGEVAILVRSPGLAGGERTTVLARGERLTETLRLQPACTIEGRVVAKADGRPVAGAAIALWKNGFPPASEASATATSGEDGSFRLQWGVAGQAVHLVATAPGFVPTESWFPLPKTPFAPRREEIQLPRATRVHGTVLDPAGRPVAGADVAVGTADAGPGQPVATTVIVLRQAARGSPPPPSGRSGDDGTYVLDGVPRETTLRIVATKKGFAHSLEGDPFCADADREEATLDLTLREAGSLLVRWSVDGASTPSTGTVFLAGAADPAAPSTPRAVMAGVGSCRIEDLAEGAYRVHVVVGWRRSEAVDAVVRAGAAAEVALTLTEGAVLEGRVVDAAGHPVKAHIQVLAADSSHSVAQRWSDQAGAFRVTDLQPGPYRLRASAGAGARVEQAVEAPSSGVVLAMPAPGSLTGRLVLPQGMARPPGCDVVVLQGRWRGIVASRECPLDAGAAFRLESVPPGEGVVVLRAGECFGGPVATTVPEGGAADLGDVPMRTGVHVTGVVRDLQGRPVADARITPSSGVPFPFRNAFTDADGRFDLGVGDRGGLGICVSATGFCFESCTAAATEGGPPVEVVLHRPAVVRGRARDAAGVPLTGARVLLFLPSDPRGSWRRDADIDSLGRFSFEVPAGEYLIEIHSASGAGQILASATVTLEDGKTATVDLTSSR